MFNYFGVCLSRNNKKSKLLDNNKISGKADCLNVVGVM